MTSRERGQRTRTTTKDLRLSSNCDAEGPVDDPSVALQQALPRIVRQLTAALTCASITCKRIPPHLPKFREQHQRPRRDDEPQKGECPACWRRSGVDRKKTKVTQSYQCEVQKGGGYVDTDCKASNLGLELSDVQAVFGEIGSHSEARILSGAATVTWT